MPRYALLCILGFMSAFVTGCPKDGDDTPGETRQTIITGRAPLNTGGKVRAICHDTRTLYEPGKIIEDSSICNRCVAFNADIDENGAFKIDAKSAHGRVSLEATGGKYIEPASGALVNVPGVKLRAVIPDVAKLQSSEVAITPWTEIAFEREGINGYAESLKILTDTLTCQSPIFADVLKVPPASPATDEIASLATPRELAYVYMGAFSQLADDLSALHGVQGSGARLNSMKLAKLLALDFGNGRIDGKGHGDQPVYLFENITLPPDVLRQRFAQSVRHFLKVHKPENDAKSWGNQSTLGETAMLDFLRCICDSPDLKLGPAGASLDLAGPALDIVSPEPRSYLAKSQDVICEARDPSGVAALDVVFLDGDDKVLGAARGVSSTLWEGAIRRVVAPLRIEALQTGPVFVRCEATDAWGNVNSLTEPLYINRGATAPALAVAEDENNHLVGHVKITCDCTGDIYSTGCTLKASAAGVDITHTLELVEQGTQKNTYAWATTNVLDGPGRLECANITHGLAHPVVQSKAVRVKNYTDGTARGAVYLDTHVRNMQVVAFAYKDGIEGDRLGGGPLDESGRFAFPMSTEYRGPVLFQASYSPDPSRLAEYHNIPLNDPNMSCNSAVLKLLVDHYEPGEDIEWLSLNVGSSMHEALAVGLWNSGAETTFEAAMQRTYAAVSLYFSAGTGRPFDPRKTWVADLTTTKRWSDEQEVMGLFHVGLSRLAVDLSLEKYETPRKLTIEDILVAMRKDLSDGVLDGKEHGSQIYMDRVELTPDFFRIDLARAIRRWVDKADFAGEQIKPMNASGLTKESVTSRSPGDTCKSCV